LPVRLGDGSLPRATRPQLANDEEPGHLLFVEVGRGTAPLRLCQACQAAPPIGRPQENGTERLTLRRAEPRLDDSKSKELALRTTQASRSAGGAFLRKHASQEQVAMLPEGGREPAILRRWRLVAGRRAAEDTQGTVHVRPGREKRASRDNQDRDERNGPEDLENGRLAHICPAICPANLPERRPAQGAPRPSAAGWASPKTWLRVRTTIKPPETAGVDMTISPIGWTVRSSGSGPARKT
jgi:hypothetical protein